ncbi:hypothetical protein PQR08_18690 [Caballeronia jiangsuensis]|uniref:Uncharacterized protein n=2 Tax=Caballeronia TaxID=1827195 RepID=A0ABW9CP03_9BURK
MALGDRPVVEMLGPDDVEEFIGHAARLGEALEQRMTQGRFAVHVAQSPWLASWLRIRPKPAPARRISPNKRD